MIAYQDLQFGKFLGEGSGALLVDAPLFQFFTDLPSSASSWERGSDAFEQTYKTETTLLFLYIYLAGRTLLFITAYSPAWHAGPACPVACCVRVCRRVRLHAPSSGHT